MPVSVSKKDNNQYIPRLLTHYKDQTVPYLMEKLNIKNINRLPKIEKVVLNIGLGDARDNANALLAFQCVRQKLFMPHRKVLNLEIKFKDFKKLEYKRNKAVVKSLKTLDRTQALASARILYIDIKGKIDRGERLKSITTPELVECWLAKLHATITTTPHEGIVPQTYKQKRSYMRRWL